MATWTAVIGWVFGAWAIVGAEPLESLPRLAAGRCGERITVDGRLDEACWRQAPVTSAFHVLGKEKATPAAETRCQALFTEQALVFAIVCGEPGMAALIGASGQRDGPIWIDDSVELFLQHSPTSYYHFGINCRGARYDARVQLTPDGRSDPASASLWDGVWEAAVHHDVNAWVVEIRIPFASLGVTPRTPKAWRFNAGRTAARRRQYSAWAPVLKGFHDVARFGWLDDLDADFSRFVVGGDALSLPPLFVGRNRVRLALPVRGGDARFLVSTFVREWTAEPTTAHFLPGAPVQVENGTVPVTLDLPVERAGILHEAGIAILDAETGAPVLLRAQLFKVPPPFKAELDWAVFYHSDRDASVIATLTVAEASARGRLQARLFGADARMLRQTVIDLDRSGICRLPIALADLPVGFYRIEVVADLPGLGRFAESLRFYLTSGPFD